MGVFNKINEKSGVIFTIILITLALFILGGDLLTKGSLFSGDRNVGEIAGKDISYEEYNQVLDQAKQNMGGINDQNMMYVHSQVWAYFVNKYGYQQQFDKLGLKVTEDELIEMTSGKTENLYYGFMDLPIFKDSTGQFSRRLFDDWRKRMEKSGKDQEFFENYKQQQIVPDRLRSKYLALFQQGLYVTKEEAQREYFNQNNKAEARYLYVPYYTLPDSAVSPVTKDEVEAYINNHEKEFEKPLRANIEFVTFDVKPSKNDNARAQEEFAALKQSFIAETDDSLFVISNSENPTPASVVGMGDLPESLKSKSDSLEKGNVVGPILDAGKFKLYKVSDVIEDPADTNYFASARHILFMTQGKPDTQKDSIKRKAQQVLDQLKKKQIDFPAAVSQYSEDGGSKSTGGEYPWFGKGKMVKPFEKAVFDAKSTGLVPYLVETSYGYHIIDVTDVKSNKKFKLNVVEKEVLPTEGREKAYQQAIKFSEEAKDTASFRQIAKKDSFNIEKFPALTWESGYVGSLMNPREIVKWALTEGSSGDVSKVYQIGDKFVIVSLIAQRKKGTATADEVFDELKFKILNEKKGDKIVEKLKGINGDIDKKAEVYGATASVGTVHDATLGSNSVQGIGNDPIIAGTIFGLQPGKRTLPLKGEGGVVILELIKIDNVQAVADYSDIKKNLLTTRKQYILTEVDNAIRENADIEDNRVKFY